MIEGSWSIWVDPLVYAGLLVTVGTAIGWIWRRCVRPVLHMAKDWHGTSDRPGVPGHKGVMVRLAEHDEMLAEIRDQLTPNGGKSLKDAIDRIARHMGLDDAGQ